MRINWVNKKKIDWEAVMYYMDFSIKENQFSNDGPLQEILSNKLRLLLGINDDKSIVLTSSGTAALHALVSSFNMYLQRDTKWATQDYTFPVSAQGVLKNSIIVDINYDDVSPSIEELEKVKDKIDGIIVTNVFGFSSVISIFVEWCNKNEKFLLFDNATAPYTLYNFTNVNNFGNGCIISLHHTKPLGFGEGGVIIVDKVYEPYVRKAINFGYTKTLKQWSPHGSNWRMSDIAASYVLQHLEKFYDIVEKHQELAEYFVNGLKQTRFRLLKPYNYGLHSCLPIVFGKNIDIQDVEYKKYYEPLMGLDNSKKLFKDIVCFPLNADMTTEDLDYIINYLKTK